MASKFQAKLHCESRVATSASRLELEHLLGSIAELAKGAADLALLHAVLGARNGLVLGGRAADERLDLVALSLGEVLVDSLSGDVASLTLPARRGVVEEVDNVEAARVLGGEGVPLLAKDCVLALPLHAFFPTEDSRMSFSRTLA